MADSGGGAAGGHPGARDSVAALPHGDLLLARRLEMTEARANAAFVDARGRLEPDVGACWIDVAGALAMFDGVDSPLTQSFGLGLFDSVGEPEMQRLEDFFHARGAPVLHEICPLADPALIALLGERGYRPVEFTNVVFRPAPRDGSGGDGVDPSIRVRRIEPDEADHWAAVAAEGWSSESAEISDFVREFGRVSVRSEGTRGFLAESDGMAVAAGSLFLGDGVALLSGASTVPAARRRGAQQALLQTRLRFAAENGMELAMMGAQPGSASQRNAERQGFRVAYTRVKWRLHE